MLDQLVSSNSIAQLADWSGHSQPAGMTAQTGLQRRHNSSGVPGCSATPTLQLPSLHPAFSERRHGTTRSRPVQPGVPGQHTTPPHLSSILLLGTRLSVQRSHAQSPLPGRIVALRRRSFLRGRLPRRRPVAAPPPPPGTARIQCRSRSA